MEQLFNHQQAVIPEILRSLRPDNPTLLVSPTGSGKTVMAAEVALHFKTVLWVAHRIELIDQAKAENGKNVQVMSVLGAVRHGPHKVDLLIIDEAHRGMAKTYRELIEKYVGAYVLGLTATPLRTDGQGLSDIFSEIVQCSSVRELIGAGYLVPYRAFEARDEALEQLANLRKRGGDFDQGELGLLMAKPRLVGDVVREYKKHAKGRKAVAFCVNVKHSQMLREAFKAAGIKAAHLDGRASLSLRRKTLEQLRKGKIDVLCNVNLFTEGWDCPSVSCVIMARPTQSLTLYLQSVGRGMRTSPGKENLLILDHAGNIARHGYPDDERDWQLESEGQQLKREVEIAELERLHALGFDSIEDELEEKARHWEQSYSASYVASVVPCSTSHMSSYLRNCGIETPLPSKSKQARYQRKDIDLLRRNVEASLTLSEIRALQGIHAVTKRLKNLGLILEKHGVFPQSGRGWPASQITKRYLKADIVSLIEARRLFLRDTVRSSEACRILGIRQDNKVLEFLRGFGVSTVGKSNEGRYWLRDIENLKTRMAGKKPKGQSA